ncbi:DEAD-box ATP-dependent RNA helicase 52C-like [Cynara cardunculus var. scolymus]|uniref:RNA helicase n=1 Tax=Cynara cardunculus var. scolymus TaxID=59895 RepID=A0A103XN22_CYNCS|nr:DEAD-box ATP-dependent RNA helicase 52C-like [Cynara cardunculus var. scolymus]KVH93813.1 DNA/RNA helicase, DEAD/DEAH box type, N-terminal [Cynara cardunculus var. scolymus]
MSYSYFPETYAEKPVRQPGRSNYNPPHLRDENIKPFGYQTGSSRTGSQAPNNGRGRGRYGGGGRGGGRGFVPGYNEVDRQFREPYRRTRDQYDALAEKLNEVELVDENPSMGINFDAYEDIPVETSGSDVPKPVNTFSEIDLGEALNDNIRNRCKYVKPTPIQRHAIPVALAGRDLMACAQTGSGKTAAFCFPIINGVLKSQSPAASQPAFRRREMTAHPLALILSPTRELCCQIHEEARKFCYQTGVRVAVAYGGAPIGSQLRSFEKGVDILVATPGRLTDVIERSKVSLTRIKYLALDEADRMLDMGFEPQIRKIVQCLGMPPPGRRQTMLFSATFPEQIQRLASDFLSNYVFLSVGRVGSSTDLILQKVVYVDDMEKQDYLRNLLHEQKAKGNLGKNALTLVFVETKRGAESLKHWLCQIGFPASTIHGDKVQFERERALQLFKNGVTPILVATDVASRGLDIPRVAHVINFDLPKDIDSYVHRIGRTGRAGKSGLATAFFSAKNASIAKALSEVMKEAHQESPNWLAQYIDGSSCGDRRYRSSSRFGGRDYRSSTNSNSYSADNNSYSTGYGAADYGGENGGSGYGSADYGGATGGSGYGSADYGEATGGSGYGSADYGGATGGVDYDPPAQAEYGGHGYESIVAGGWE